MDGDRDYRMIRRSTVRRSSVRSFVGLLVTAVALFVVMGGTAAALDHEEMISVVVVGDSYSSGVGARDYWPDDKCIRSFSSWGERYVDMLRGDGLWVGRLKNEACVAATTTRVSQQAGVVDEETDLVLLTIGGNDVRFDLIVFACFMSRACGAD